MARTKSRAEIKRKRKERQEKGSSASQPKPAPQSKTRATSHTKSPATSRPNSRPTTPGAGSSSSRRQTPSSNPPADYDSAPSPKSSSDFVELALTDDDVPMKPSIPVNIQAKHPTKLTAKKRKAKGKGRATEDIEDTPPVDSLACTSTFTPFRPMLLGVKVESDEEDEVTEDEKDAEKDALNGKQVGEHAPKPQAPKVGEKQEPAVDALWEEDENAELNTSVLLLPDNVHVEVKGSDTDEDEEDTTKVLEGVHMVDDSNTKGVPRYWMDTESDLAHFLAEADQSKVCRKCKRPGHRQDQCPHIVCQTCGKFDDHERRDCPWALICYGCGKRGHRKQDCPDPAARRLRAQGCPRCGIWDHTENSCPSLWRVYVYRKDDDRRRVMEDKENAEGWKKQAVGGDPDERWCYNCAQEGHLGDNVPTHTQDCQRQRGSLARAAQNSAFSDRMASRGPYALSWGNPQGKGTHTRWDDDLPYAATGFAAFKGADAGAKSRQKERQRQMARDRQRDRDPRDYEHDWFNTPVGHARDRDRGGWGSERRQGGGRGSRDARERSPVRSGFDSDSHRSRSPDWRRHRHQPPPRPVIGKLSTGMPPTLASRISSPSPAAGRGRGRSGTTSGGGSLLHRAISNTEQKRRASQGRGGGSASGSGAEDTYWRSGAGGGNVALWGADLDREMRDMRDNRPRAGPSRPGRGDGGGDRGRGQARGQRYTGGY